MKEKRLQRIKERISRTFAKIDRMRENRASYPFAKFVRLMPYMTQDTIKQIEEIAAPVVFDGKLVPQDLQLVTFGMLTELQNAPVKNDYYRTCCNLVSVLMKVPVEKVGSFKAYEVLGLVNMIRSEMERIGKLFQGLQTDKTSEELSAGIERLDFGSFGLADWYAQRMGIIDHEEVFETPWARVYQCMRIDHENNEFEKRYRKIIENKYKRKK